MASFQSEKITPRLTRIRGLAGELMYLVDAADDAILIDTGCGVGSLHGFIRELTRKPVTVFLTHGHVDHAMGAPEFSRVYMNPTDDQLCDQHSSFDVRADFLCQAAGIQVVDRNAFIPARSESYRAIQPGDSFDFDDVTLQICEGAGHTPGSVTVLIVEEQVLILGDACCKFTFLFDALSSGLKNYREMLIRLDQQTKGKYNRVLLSHGDGNATIAIIPSVISLCDDVLNGHSDEIPFLFMGQPALIAKAIDRNFERIDGGEGNIVYAQSKLAI
jgi:hydroxyacylglutathione hydrolase